MGTKKQGLSFYRKAKISLGLMGIIPFLLTVYLVLKEVGTPSELMIICAALILVSILLGFILLRRSSDQLATLAQETSHIDSDDVLQPLHVEVDGELKDIATNFNSVVEQLNQANRDIQSRSFQLQEFAANLSDSYEQLENENKLRENENRLREHLCRYVDKDLVERLMFSQEGRLLRNERRIVTVMFVDIRSFTTIAEQLEPEEVFTMLNEYFTIMVDIVFKYNGMLDKLVGDQMMAIFGHMTTERKGARAAVRAAIEMQKAAIGLMRKRARAGLPIFKIGIGINTGSAILGSVGSENRKDYTVIGDTVNTAARFEQHAGEKEIVISERTSKHLPKNIPLGNRQELSLKNRLEPAVCYTLIGKRKNVTKAGAKKPRKLSVTPSS